jgi:hypothetical protein
MTMQIFQMLRNAISDSKKRKKEMQFHIVLFIVFLNMHLIGISGNL